MSPELSAAEVAQLAEQLQRLKPGFLPYPLFEQVARIIALPIVEFVPLRKSGDTVEVLLLKRPADDPIFPSMEHTPGTVIRATDANEGESVSWPAFDRILIEELKGLAVGAPRYVGSVFHRSKRGAEQAQIYWVEVLEDPTFGIFHDINHLPLNLIESQKKFIELAAKDFFSQSTSTE